MTFIRACSAAIIITTIAACSSDHQSAPVDTTAEQAAIVQIEAEWSDLFGAGDLDAIEALMAENAVFIMPGSSPIVGVGKIRAVNELMLESDDEVSWASDFASVAPSGDMAYDYGTVTTKRADGSIVKGHYLVVWVKEDGQWKIAADIFN